MAREVLTREEQAAAAVVHEAGTAIGALGLGVVIITVSHADPRGARVVCAFNGLSPLQSVRACHYAAERAASALAQRQAEADAERSPIVAP